MPAEDPGIVEECVGESLHEDKLRLDQRQDFLTLSVGNQPRQRAVDLKDEVSHPAAEP